MSRSTSLARFTTLAFLLALAACDRSSTAPVAAPAPDLHIASAVQELTAPMHAGGTVGQIIGPAGGSISFTDPRVHDLTFRLDVPAGAVRTPTLFRMTVLAGSTYRVDLSATVGKHDVGAHGFDRDVDLTIAFGSANFFHGYPSQVRVAWFPDRGSPVPQGTTLDIGRRTATGHLQHFSKYGLIL